MFKTVKNKKIFEEILDQIKELMVTKQLIVGQKMPSEIELSGSLGISRSSLREALRVLDVLGIIEAKAGEGTVIKQADPESLKNIMSLIAVSKGLDTVELFEVRTFLEVESASLAALRRTDSDLELIKTNLIQMDGPQLNKEREAFLDFLFHQSIVKASKNRMLVMLMELISGLLEEQIRTTRNQVAASAKVIKHFQNQHWAIYQSIENQDRDGAKKNMFEHFSYAQLELGLQSGNIGGE
jgi:GntR family transcriptional repressor for pyruvate dehydrogenase complex